MFCGERSSVTLYKQKQKQNSTALQLLGEIWGIATDTDVSESQERNLALQLSSKRKYSTIRCTENTEIKGKNFSGRNVETSLYLLILLLDDSRTFQEEQILNRILERLENEPFLACLPHGQSTLTRKCVAEHILGKWH